MCLTAKSHTAELASLATQVWLRNNVRAGVKVPHHIAKKSTRLQVPIGHVKPGVEALSTARSLFQSVTHGVFKSFQSSAYSHPQGPYRSSRLTPRASAPRYSVTSATRSRARPSLHPSALIPRPGPGAQQLGLGSARNFSHGAGSNLFANVVANVPLGLRALGDDLLSGADDKKWKRVRHSVRNEMKIEAELKARAQAGGDRQRQARLEHAFESRLAEHGRYFVVPVTEFSASTAPSAAAGAANRLPVVLSIAVEPELSFDLSEASSSTFSPSHWRVLSPSTLSHLSAITTAYDRHARRVKALHNRLWAAGVFDSPGAARVEAVSWRAWDGREIREVHVVFDPARWDVRDVRSAVGESAAEGDGGATWWRIVDLQAEKESEEKRTAVTLAQADGEELGTLAKSSASFESLSSASSASDRLRHDVISSTFVLPAMDHEDSSSSCAFSDYDLDRDTTTTMTSSLDLSPPMSPSMTTSASSFLLDSDVIEDDEASQAQREWEDARQDLQTSQSQTVSMADSYADGVRDFLRDLDAVAGPGVTVGLARL